jgi:hypothetical protein
VCSAEGVPALDDLASSPAAIRNSFSAVGRLLRLQPPLLPPSPHAAVVAPLPVAPWVLSMGSSSGEVTLDGGGGCRGTLPCASVDDVSYMARSIRMRLLHRLKG